LVILLKSFSNSIAVVSSIWTYLSALLVGDSYSSIRIVAKHYNGERSDFSYALNLSWKYLSWLLKAFTICRNQLQSNPSSKFIVGVYRIFSEVINKKSIISFLMTLVYPFCFKDLSTCLFLSFSFKIYSSLPLFIISSSMSSHSWSFVNFGFLNLPNWLLICNYKVVSIINKQNYKLIFKLLFKVIFIINKKL